MVAANNVISANVLRRRGPGRPFKPGQSGNPLGRPKAALDAQELARSHTVEAIATLVKALDDPKHCVAAASALLDRGWGRPTAFIGGDASAAPLAIDFRWAPALPEHEGASTITSTATALAAGEHESHTAVIVQRGGDT
jgi:hypothetical protein